MSMRIGSFLLYQKICYYSGPNSIYLSEVNDCRALFVVRGTPVSDSKSNGTPLPLRFSPSGSSVGYRSWRRRPPRDKQHPATVHLTNIRRIKKT